MTSRLLLCTDLDRTLLPNGTQSESQTARQAFAALATHAGVTLAYVTGRDRDLARLAIRNYRLPQPDFVISDVGTRIHVLEDDAWEDWPEWATEINDDWAGFSHAQLVDVFRDLADLRLQETGKQNIHKLSYYVPLQADRVALLAVMSSRLDQRGIHASLTWSVDEPAAKGLLDVLPQRATKLHAIQFLMRKLDFTRQQAMFAGDSGNDLPVLASEIPSVLVANASPEVREAAIAQARAAGHETALYLAAGGFMDMNGNYSAGILEGIAHFHPDFL